MAAIHLIKNNRGLPQITPIERGSTIYRSGYWDISESTAKDLIEGNIFFHERQNAPSFFGGIIKSAEREVQSQYPDRIVFTFQSDPGCKGIRTPREGWAQEMKIIP